MTNYFTLTSSRGKIIKKAPEVIMEKTRHEEYLTFDDKLPFYLQIGLKRTATSSSTAKNWHENLEFQWCTNGKGFVILDGEKYDFNKNDIAAVNSNVIHYTGTSDLIEYSCLIISTSFCTQIGIDYTQIYFEPVIKDSDTIDLFKKLQQIYMNDTETFRVASLYIAVLELIISICKKHSRLQSAPKLKKHQFEDVKATIQYLRENFQSKLSLDQIARNVYADKYVLSHNFKKITGQTIIEYLNCYRCKKAAEFIEDGSSVAEAALRCGFENMSFFTNTFKHYLNKLPSQYKQTDRRITSKSSNNATPLE